MTVKEIRERVAAIEAMKHDAEAAHSAEDSLHQDVLRAIQRGAENPAALAANAPLTTLIDFPRWCA